MPIRRLVLLIVAGLLLTGVGFTLWQGYQVHRDLTRAEVSVTALRAALSSNNEADRDRAISDLQVASASAADNTSGAWWDMLTHTPFFGDDARGLQVLSRTLSLVSSDGVAPMADSVDKLNDLNVGDRIDVEAVESLQAPVSRASQVFSAAANDVNEIDSSGFLGFFDQRYVDYAKQLDGAASSLRAADTTAQVLPDMVGANGSRDYLLLFQNNAEIRATGGMPGSWARIHAEDGRIEMLEQGTSGDFPTADEPVVSLTSAELAIYGEEYGQFFQDPGFAPDFQRGAQIWNAHWERRFPNIDLDGVLALDPVGMSYLLPGTGPVEVADRDLTSENLVRELLSRPYIELEPTEQDRFFQAAARAIFDAATDDLNSPVRFLEGFQRAASEGRFLLAPFDRQVARKLEGSRVLGELSGVDGNTPHVDIGINDATTSKMSYYLRYRATVNAESCKAGRQQLSARMTLSQTISPSEAAQLPPSVTGRGDEVTEPGDQAVLVRIYGPYGGSIDDLMTDGKRVTLSGKVVRSEGRPVVTLALLLENRNDLVLNWSMETAPMQEGDGILSMTPSVVPGQTTHVFESACPQD